MALYLIKDLDDDYHSRVGVWQITESEEELKEHIFGGDFKQAHHVLAWYLSKE